MRDLASFQILRPSHSHFILPSSTAEAALAQSFHFSIIA